MEHTHLMKTGNFDEFCFKKRWHLNIQWEWPRCPSPWHSRHLSCWVFNVWSRQVWDNQCLTAVLSGIPCVFSIFNLRKHACNRKKSLHSTAGSENIWHLCCQNLFHTAITISETNVGSSSKSSKKTDPVNTLRPRDSFCFLLVSSHFFYPKFKRPIPSQKWILKQQVRIQPNIPKHRRKSPAHVRTPSVIAPAPLPKRPIDIPFSVLRSFPAFAD